MIHRGAFYTAEVRQEQGRKMRVALGESLGIDAPEVEPSDDLCYEHEDRSGELRQLVEQLIHAALLSFSGVFAYFSDFIYDHTANVVYGSVLVGDEEHQRLFRVILKGELSRKGHADIVSLISPASSDEAIHQRTLIHHLGRSRDHTVEEGRLIVGVLGVLLLDKAHQLGRVDGIVQIYLTVGAVRPQARHNSLETGDFNPSAVPAISAFPFVSIDDLCHSFTPK